MNVRPGSFEATGRPLGEALSALDPSEQRALVRRFQSLSRTERLDAVCHVLGRGYPALYRELSDDLCPTLDSALDLSSLYTLIA